MQLIEMAGGVCAPLGFKASGLHCGIRKNQTKKDLALIVAERPCSAAAVYTRNKVYGAPITVTRAHLQNGTAQAVVCNSGNANTCNADGVEKANAMCALVSAATGLDVQDILVASTGVIGQPIDMTPIAAGMGELVSALSTQGGQDAAEAILTTDLQAKQCAYAWTQDGVTVRMGAMAKGSGMIAPNMATMLGFLTTDAAISPAMLQQALSGVTCDTFNMVSVDGDTSTNDMVTVLASGLAGNPVIDAPGRAYDAFVEAMYAVCVSLARRIAKDGEGATKLLTCNVAGAPDKQTARSVAQSVVHSSLLKAAMFGADANWGRVLCAIGYTQADFSIDTVEVAFASKQGSIVVCRAGSGVPFDESEAKKILLEDEIEVWVDLRQGDGVATAWGCDLTYDYVKINGDYRS